MMADVVCARPGDAAVLATLHGSSFDAPWDEDAFSKLLAQSAVEALLIPGRAFIMTRRAADEAEILTIATRPEHRKQGLASALLQRAKARLAEQGVTSVFLEVAANNKAAQALYLGAGFAQVARRAGYYLQAEGGREDALVLKCSLPAGSGGTPC